MGRQLEKVERRISKNGHYEVLFSSIEKSTGRCETDALPASAPPVTCLQNDTSVIRSASPEAGVLISCLGDQILRELSQDPGYRAGTG